MSSKINPFSAITMYCGGLVAWLDATLIDSNVVELRTSVGGQPPLIERGPFQAMMAKADAWHATRRDEGFQCPFNNECRSYKN